MVNTERSDWFGKSRGRVATPGRESTIAGDLQTGAQSAISGLRNGHRATFVATAIIVELFTQLR